MIHKAILTVTHILQQKSKKILSKLLHRELFGMGITDAETDEFGYVYATIPATAIKKIFRQFVFVHMWILHPTAADTNVKPIHHRYYDGNDIVLPDDPSQVLSVSKFALFKGTYQ